MQKKRWRPPLKLTEHDKMCREIMNWKRLRESQYPFLRLLRHIPNEGKRDPRHAHAIGIIAGLPDYLLPVPTEVYRQLWLEVKTPGDKPTAAQEKWAHAMASYGDCCVWRDTISGCIDVLEYYCRTAKMFLDSSTTIAKINWR